MRYSGAKMGKEQKKGKNETLNIEGSMSIHLHSIDWIINIQQIIQFFHQKRNKLFRFPFFQQINFKLLEVFHKKRKKYTSQTLKRSLSVSLSLINNQQIINFLSLAQLV